MEPAMPPMPTTELTARFGNISDAVVKIFALQAWCAAVARLISQTAGQMLVVYRTDKFARVPNRRGNGGAVVLEEAPAWFVGTVETRVDGGDHVGFVLAPVEWEARADGPLLRLGDALDIAPGHPA